MKEAEDLKAGLRKRIDGEVAQARAQFDAERDALFAAAEAQRKKMHSEAEAELRAERTRLRAFADSSQRVAELGGSSRIAPAAPAWRTAAHRPAVRAALAAGALGVALAALLWRAWAVPTRDHPVPFAHPGAMAWQGDTLWVADAADHSIHKLVLSSGELQEERAYPLPGSQVTALAARGDRLYVADSEKNDIEEFQVGGVLSQLKSWPLAAHGISALACDGADLYAAFSPTGRIYQYSLDGNLTVARTFYGPPTLVGMAVASGEFWTADRHTGLLLAHRRNAALSVKAAYGAAGVDPGALCGFARRGRTAWLAVDGRAAILERPMWRLPRRRIPDLSAPVAAAGPDAAYPPLLSANP
jgi:hypothetical protein